VSLALGISTYSVIMRSVALPDDRGSLPNNFPMGSDRISGFRVYLSKLIHLSNFKPSRHFIPIVKIKEEVDPLILRGVL
jgi:hypothetical protein